MASGKRKSDGEREAEKRIEDVRREGGRHLKLSGLGLKTVPESVGTLSSLTMLDLNENKLSTLPDWIGSLPNLRRLYLAGNPLIELPGWLSEFENLYLPRLGLTRAPDCIREARHLSGLALDHNSLTELPEWIGELNRLQTLWLDNNNLSSLPSSMKVLTNLTSLQLQGNPELGIPEELLETRDAKKILDYYFRTRESDARPLNEAKLILVGRGEVGKTSLVDRLIHERFEPQNKTEGIQITKWSIRLGTDDVLLHVWDFGGQEIMHATHQFFMTERSLYVLVLDGRLGAEDTDVEYWLKLIESFGGDSPVIVVLNKIQAHPFDLNRRGLLEKYPGRIRDSFEPIARMRRALKSYVPLSFDTPARCPGCAIGFRQRGSRSKNGSPG